MKEEKSAPVEGLRRIWLAGLGALAEAEKKGDELFRTLVAEGKKYEDVWREPVGKAGAAVRESVESAKRTASSTFRDLEATMDRQVAAAMKRLGVATHEDIQALRREISKLSKTVETEKKSARKKKSTKK
jgi:poly(hydroxyalkanoate) granule-associated protein